MGAFLNIINTLIWIIAYTSILVNIVFFSMLYMKYKLKIELAFTIMTGNILLITIAAMVLHKEIINPNSMLLIIMNSAATLFLTIPLCLYTIRNMEKRNYIILSTVFIITVVLQNIIIKYQLYFLIGIVYAIGYFIVLFPLFRKKNDENNKNVINKQFNKMFMRCFFIFLGFFMPLIIIAIKLYDIPFLISIYFGVFLTAYQLPSLLYCKKRLFSKAIYDNIDLSSPKRLSVLTKRENEVAMEIYSGLKYEEIAEKLFITLSAVKKHTYNIYRKLDINNNRELIMIMAKEEPIIEGNS
jgi:DNA-binding CsgD family transcriptional regulator